MIYGSNNIISTKRLTTANGKKTFPAGFNLTDVSVYLEQLDIQTVAMLNDIPAFNSFRIITYEVIDIIEGDMVIDQQSNQYIVHAVQHYQNNVDVDNHSEVIIYKKFD